MNFFWRELFDPNEPESAGQRAQGIMFEAVVAARTQYELWQWARVIPNQPGIPKPAGLANYVDFSFMLDEFWANANAILTGALLLLGLLGRVRWAYAAALFTFHVQFVARYGLGKVQHSSNALGFAVLALAVSHLAYNDPVLRRKASTGLTVVLLSIGYLSAGFSKLYARGIWWVDGRHLWLWIEQKRIDSIANAGQWNSNPLQQWALHNIYLATFLLMGGLAAELSASLMWWRRFRRWVMLALAGMHLGITYVMDIAFTGNVIVLLALALPVAEMVDRLAAPRTPHLPDPSPT